MLALVIAVHAESKKANTPKGNLTNIKKILSILKETGSEPVVLRGQDKKKMVIVTPKLVGRVMCTSFDGADGQTNAFVNEKQLRAGFSTSGFPARSGADDGWNDFGAADRIWFAPEGGKYGLFLDPGVEQNWNNYRMNYPLHEVQYNIIEQPKDGRSVTFRAPINLTNYSGSKISLMVTRKVSVLEYCPFTIGFGNTVEFVGFESKTRAKNVGNRPLKKDTTPLSLWTVGMFNGGEHVVVLLPYKEGAVSKLGEPVTTEYFRYFLSVPKDDRTLAQHWSIENGCVLIKADGKVELKLEMLKRRSLGRLASIDLKDFTMTVVEFNLYPELDYTASFFLPYDGDLLNGGVMSSFMNVGETGNPEKPAIYELETCSPIIELQPNEQFCHISRTYRLRGDKASIAEICKRFFKVDIKTLKKFDKASQDGR